MVFLLNPDPNGLFGGGQTANDNAAVQSADGKHSSMSGQQHREQYYATVRKPQSQSPCRDSANALERIPEYSEDIYPYATFHLPDQENLSAAPSRHSSAANATATGGVYDTRESMSANQVSTKKNICMVCFFKSKTYALLRFVYIRRLAAVAVSAVVANQNHKNPNPKNTIR